MLSKPMMIMPIHQRQMSFKIYTKTGDKGESSLYTGDRVPKDHDVFGCLGNIDELNAHLGLAREHCKSIKDLPSEVGEQLEELQARLLDLGSHVATPRQTEKVGAERKINQTAFDTDNTDSLEKWIDTYTE